jgi:hypothetical protein
VACTAPAQPEAARNSAKTKSSSSAFVFGSFSGFVFAGSSIMVLFCNALRQRLSFQPVMRGQKRVDDARERAYDPRIHLLRKKVFTKMDGLPGQARQ